ncbi:hypothetical protein EV126DRAFT_81701 [Verticillium dahliae]|nr:hypothetical protein EV126DRAFT_81701 [Verticillium dahliae]
MDFSGCTGSVAPTEVCACAVLFLCRSLALSRDRRSNPRSQTKVVEGTPRQRAMDEWLWLSDRVRSVGALEITSTGVLCRKWSPCTVLGKVLAPFSSSHGTRPCLSRLFHSLGCSSVSFRQEHTLIILHCTCYYCWALPSPPPLHVLPSRESRLHLPPGHRAPIGRGSTGHLRSRKETGKAGGGGAIPDGAPSNHDQAGDE